MTPTHLTDAELVANGTSDMKREIEGYMDKKEEIEEVGDDWGVYALEQKMAMLAETMNLFHIAVGQRFLQFVEKKARNEIAELVDKAAKELQMDLEGVPEEVQGVVQEAFLEKAHEYYDDNVRPNVIDKIKSGVAVAVLMPALDASRKNHVDESGGGVEC